MSHRYRCRLALLLKWIVERQRKMIAGGRRTGVARGKEVGREGVFDRSRGASLRCRHRRRWEARHTFVEDLMAQRLLWSQEEEEDGIELRWQQRLRRCVPTRRSCSSASPVRWFRARVSRRRLGRWRRTWHGPGCGSESSEGARACDGAGTEPGQFCCSLSGTARVL